MRSMSRLSCGMSACVLACLAAPAYAQPTAYPAAGDAADAEAPAGMGAGAGQPEQAAQEPPPEGQAQGEIVVTAQGFAQQLQDVPLSVQAFTGEQLEDQGFRDLRDIISLVPSASEGRGNAAGIRSYQIRGVSSFLGDSTIGYYLDEAAYVIPNRNYAPVGRSFDIARVEVLRGPQGTLYGLGSMGGTIRFITAEPDLNDFRARGNIGISGTGEGGEANYYVDFAASVPIIEDRLAIRAVSSYERRGGFARSPSFPNDVDDDTLINQRVRLIARPVDELTIKLGIYHSDTSDDWGQNFAAVSPARFPLSRVPGRNQQVYDMYTGSISYDFGGFSLESSTGYVDRRDDSQGPLVLLGFPAPIPPTLVVFSESESFVQEVRAVSQGDGPFQWVVGGIYQDARNLEDIVVSFGPPISARSIFDSKSWAVFGEASIGLFNDTLRPLVGLRYFEDDRTFFTQSRAPVLGTATNRDAKFDSLNPRFNLSWTPNEDINIYANVARGFRSGTFNNAAAVAAGAGTVGFEVTPDELWSYEVGGKLNLFDNSLYVELVGYFIDWSDIQLNYTVAGGVQLIRNAGDVEGKGLELVLSWRPVRGLTINASANVNETEFVSLVNPAVFAATPSIRVGRQVASVPDTTVNVGAAYRHPVGLGGADLSLNANYSYISEQGDVGDPLGRFGSDHGLLRGRVGLQWENIGVHLFGENLLEDDDPIQISGSGSTRYYPRVIGVELSFDF